MTKRKEKKLVLEDGHVFHGLGYGADTQVVGEIIFNTSMVGYQELLSDPAYAGRIVVMTYPLIGQYGITDEDFESRNFSLGGMVVRECCETPSNFRYTKTLSEELEDRGIPCLSGPDTRMITRILRNSGSMQAAIVDEEMPDEEALALARKGSPALTAREVTCAKRWFSRTPHHSFDVVAIDCGIKYSVVGALNDRGCNVTIVPCCSSVEEVMAFNPDGVLISNGPGAPDSLPEVVELINALKGRVPIFGICLGQEFIALSYGARVERMKVGHYGGHPVLELASGRITPVEHNHSYEVVSDSLAGTPLEITHVDVADGCIEGIECRDDRVFAVQFYPEGAPGPQDSLVLFDKFIKMMEESKNA